MTDAEAYRHIVRVIAKLAAEREHAKLRAIQKAVQPHRPTLTVIEGGLP